MMDENIIALPSQQNHELGNAPEQLMKTVFSMRAFMGGLLGGDYTRGQETSEVFFSSARLGSLAERLPKSGLR